MLIHFGIPEAGFNLKNWAEHYKSEKATWCQSVEEILAQAKSNKIINNKAAVIESLDLRFCKRLRQVVSDLERPEFHNNFFFENLSKLKRIIVLHDTAIMKGIHMSSLIIWYDYFIAKKKINPSDIADLFHSIMYPYCEVVIADKSRIDCIRRIQREDNFCQDVKFYTKSEFKRLLIESYPEIYLD